MAVVLIGAAVEIIGPSDIAQQFAVIVNKCNAACLQRDRAARKNVININSSATVGS